MGYIKHTESDYFNQMVALLPRGPAWDITENKHLNDVLTALSFAFARVDAEGQSLLSEMVPSNVRQLLPDWERVLGLPDGCLPVENANYAQRLAGVIRRFREVGSQTPAYFQKMVEDAGYTNVRVVVYRAPRFGRARFGYDHFGTRKQQFHWSIYLHDPEIAWSRFGTAVFGQNRFGQSSYAYIKCLIEKYKPAHTTVSFYFI